MKNLYHGHDEQMVKHEMLEVDLAMEQARLLREAGPSGTNLLARGVKTLRNLWKARERNGANARTLMNSSGPRI